MYHFLFTEEELEYLNQLITKKISETPKSEIWKVTIEARVLESIKRKLDDPENADGYYDAVDY
tara:strand:+ start:233 stop:421 length:189 start_codon:yes stop_codon:yes gene_type:complete